MTGGYYGNRRSRLELQDSIWKLQDKVEGEEKQRDELKGELESIHLYWITHCGKFGKQERVLQTSQMHPQLDIRRAKRVNQFSYNIAVTVWALEHVLSTT